MCEGKVREELIGERDSEWAVSASEVQLELWMVSVMVFFSN